MITLNSYIYLIKCKISACQWRQTDTVIKRKHEKNIKSLCSKPPRWNVNRGLHQMKRCEACLWRAIQDNKKYQEKKSSCYPLPWKRRVISTECCSEKSGEEEGAWFCLCGMLACFQEMGNERRMRRTWSSLRAAGFRCPCRPERGGGGKLSLLNLIKKSSVGVFGGKIWADFLTAALSSTPHTPSSLPFLKPRCMFIQRLRVESWVQLLIWLMLLTVPHVLWMCLSICWSRDVQSH